MDPESGPTSKFDLIRVSSFRVIGSVDSIRYSITNKFKTYSELDQNVIVYQAANRQNHIDQGQSINIMVHPDMPIKDLNRVYSYTMYPRIPIKNSDVFITPAYGTRLDLLANEYYKDSTLWWIIAQANGIKGFTALTTENFRGQLRIPTEIQDILSKFKSMNR